MSYEHNGIRQVEEKELKQLIENGSNECLIIDVREPDEYEAGHIPGVPLLPMNRIPVVFEQLKKDASYIFVCRSGGRSQAVAEFLKEQGFKDVQNFAGGMLTWTGEVAFGLEKPVDDVSELFNEKK